MKAWIWGAIVGIIIIILSYILPSFLCPDFFMIGPPRPTDQPVCSWLIVSNPLISNFQPFSRALLSWIIFLIITAAIGWLISKIKAKREAKQ